jgi:crotonobetainyl-CoA:carnitine CoA-transferase CaiB-like acyl-CoA transferase
LQLPSRDVGLERLQKFRVPCGPVLSIDEVVEQTDFRDAGFLRTVSDPLLGTIDVPGFPLHFSESTAGFDYEAAQLGEHNEEVLLKAAGGSEAYAALVDDGVVFENVVSDSRPSRQRFGS